jgi:hypothetical protein
VRVADLDAEAVLRLMNSEGRNGLNSEAIEAFSRVGEGVGEERDLEEIAAHGDARHERVGP